MSFPWFTIAHAVKGGRNPWTVHVYRTNRRASLTNALRRARQIRRAGYLVWIEATGNGTLSTKATR